jgi:ATP-dependent RNA helicase DDX21
MERLGKRNNVQEVDAESDEPKKSRAVTGATEKRVPGVETKTPNATSQKGKGELGPNGILLDDETKKQGSFDNFRINPETAKVLIKKGITYLFPIQSRTFDIVYDGHDLVGRDRTGSGKTMAYSLPIVEKFRAEKAFTRSDGLPKMLVLIPTRELALQGKIGLNAVTRELNELKHGPQEYQVAALYGGTDIREQMQGIRKGIDMCVATPGRIWDLIERQAIDLSSIRVIYFLLRCSCWTRLIRCSTSGSRMR